jgi:hypothetical protein
MRNGRLDHDELIAVLVAGMLSSLVSYLVLRKANLF